MLDKNMIIKRAKRNDSFRKGLIEDVLKLIESTPALYNESGWEYNKYEQCYTRRSSIYRDEEYRFLMSNYPVIYEKPGIIISIGHDGFCDGPGELAVKITVYHHFDSEEFVKNLFNNLEEKRGRLFKEWRNRMSEIADDYFKHVDISETMFQSGSHKQIRSKRFCLWSAVNDKNCPVDSEMIEKMGGPLLNVDYESLDENSYTPCLWKNNKELETIVYLKNHKVIVSRDHEAIDLSKFSAYVRWPNIYMVLVLTSTNDPTLQSMQSSLNYIYKTRMDNTFFEFASELNEGRHWIKDESGEISMTIPIIYDHYIENVLNMARKVYGTDIFSFHIVENLDIPMFDRMGTRGIKVTLNS